MLQYTELLIRIAYGYVKDLHAAEDIVQEVFIKFYHHPENYDERGEVKAFLIKMTVNKSKDYLKSWAYKKVLIQNKFFPSAGKRYADELIRKDEQTIVEDALSGLPLKQQEVLIHYYFNEMTIPEIAHILSIPESTVKTRLIRGRALLRNELSRIQWEVFLNE